MSAYKSSDTLMEYLVENINTRSPYTYNTQHTPSLTTVITVITVGDGEIDTVWDDEDLYFPDDDPLIDTSYMSAEQRLMNNLLRHYERSVRPVKKASDTVSVLMGLTLTQIFDMVSERTFYDYREIAFTVHQC